MMRLIRPILMALGAFAVFSAPAHAQAPAERIEIEVSRPSGPTWRTEARLVNDRVRLNMREDQRLHRVLSCRRGRRTLSTPIDYSVTLRVDLGAVHSQQDRDLYFNLFVGEGWRTVNSQPHPCVPEDGGEAGRAFAVNTQINLGRGETIELDSGEGATIGLSLR